MSDKNDIPERLRKYVLDEELVPPRSIVLHKGTDRQLTYWPIDREALLETLDEMDAAVRLAGPDVERDIVEAWADDIRKALGEPRSSSVAATVKED